MTPSKKKFVVFCNKPRLVEVTKRLSIFQEISPGLLLYIHYRLDSTFCRYTKINVYYCPYNQGKSPRIPFFYFDYLMIFTKKSLHRKVWGVTKK